jgi:hypothetical protein
MGMKEEGVQKKMERKEKTKGSKRKKNERQE